jgi:hypothetical protein
MRERLEQVLKIICVVLALVLVVKLVRAVGDVNSLAGVVVPEMPSLPADTNAPVTLAAKGPAKPGTNAAGTNAIGATNVSKTNGLVVAKDTNGVPLPAGQDIGSNAAAVEVATEPAATNKVRKHKAGTNITAVELAATNLVGTNISVAELAGTNSAATNLAGMHPIATNIAAGELVGTNMAGTNIAAMKLIGGTNLAAVDLAKAGNTNSVSAKKGSAKKPPMMPPMFGGPTMGMKAASLPPDVQARVDRVTDSEIFGPVMRPMPMALLGIAGNMAFLRAPSGQTGLVKEGDSVGEIKLVRIGVNRVLVEQDGQKKELMIFSGFGGESLLPKSTESSDETTKN